MPEIYATLGPCCSDADTLAAMFDAGMTGVRLNLSHITLHDAAAEIENLHLAAKNSGVKAQLLIDMQGPELRIGTLEQPVTLYPGNTVRLGGDGIPVPEIILPALREGQSVLLDDGKLLLELLNGSDARVLHGGTLQSRKSIALPGHSFPTPAVTEQDYVNLSLARDYGVTGVMQPFVRSRSDLAEVREVLDRHGGQV